MSDGLEDKKVVRLNDTQEEKEEDDEEEEESADEVKKQAGKTDWSKRVITEEYDPALLRKVRAFDEWVDGKLEELYQDTNLEVPEIDVDEIRTLSANEQRTRLHGLLAPSLPREKKEKFVNDFIGEGQALTTSLAAARKKV